MHSSLSDHLAIIVERYLSFISREVLIHVSIQNTPSGFCFVNNVAVAAAHGAYSWTQLMHLI